MRSLGSAGFYSLVRILFMKKPDYSKLNYVSGLSRLAGMFMENGDFKNAELIGEEIARHGYPVHSSEIFIKTGNLQKAKDILVPHAEELCKSSMHMSAASCYKDLGMLKEYFIELKEHELEWDTKIKGRKPS
jgi:hypothetical protein